MKYRVLMEDSVNGEKFNFAMTYDDVQNNRCISFETQAQLAWTDDQVYSHSAGVLAAKEFPTAFIASAELVEQPEVILP